MIDTAGWTIQKVFQKIVDHQLQGVMFHSEAAYYLKYLGLRKLSHIQKKQKYCELHNLDHTICFFIVEQGMLLRPNGQYKSFIPTEVYNTNAESVGLEFKRKTLAKMLNSWAEWEQETQELYTAAISWLTANHCAGVSICMDLLKEASSELVRAKKLHCSIDIAEYSLGRAEELAD